MTTIKAKLGQDICYVRRKDKEEESRWYDVTLLCKKEIKIETSLL